MFIKLIVTIITLTLTYAVQAEKLDSFKHYYLENEMGGRIAVTKQPPKSPVSPGKPFCHASNGDVVVKLSEPSLFGTQVKFLDGLCKGEEGYVSPAFIHRLFIHIEP